ncbi:MAG: hypothetical protein AAB463_02245 [Patescibacteria group bacterium]
MKHKQSLSLTVLILLVLTLGFWYWGNTYTNKDALDLVRQYNTAPKSERIQILEDFAKVKKPRGISVSFSVGNAGSRSGTCNRYFGFMQYYMQKAANILARNGFGTVDVDDAAALEEVILGLPDGELALFSAYSDAMYSMMDAIDDECLTSIMDSL